MPRSYIFLIRGVAECYLSKLRPNDFSSKTIQLIDRILILWRFSLVDRMIPLSDGRNLTISTLPRRLSSITVSHYLSDVGCTSINSSGPLTVYFLPCKITTRVAVDTSLATCDSISFKCRSQERDTSPLHRAPSAQTNMSCGIHMISIRSS